jgi:hypothetical protein
VHTPFHVIEAAFAESQFIIYNAKMHCTLLLRIVSQTLKWWRTHSESANGGILQLDHAFHHGAIVDIHHKPQTSSRNLREHQMTHFDELDRSMCHFVELICGNGFKRGTKSRNRDQGEFELEPLIEWSYPSFGAFSAP